MVSNSQNPYFIFVHSSNGFFHQFFLSPRLKWIIYHIKKAAISPTFFGLFPILLPWDSNIKPTLSVLFISYGRKLNTIYENNKIKNICKVFLLTRQTAKCLYVWMPSIRHVLRFLFYALLERLILEI